MTFRNIRVILKMMSLRLILFLAFTYQLFSCTAPVKVVIKPAGGDATATYAASELQQYLAKIYPPIEFLLEDHPAQGRINVIFQLQKGEDSRIDESYKITVQPSSENPSVQIIGGSTRAMLFAVYALLEKLGCGFYLSDETLSEPKTSLNLNDWALEDAPLYQAADRVQLA